MNVSGYAGSSVLYNGCVHRVRWSRDSAYRPGCVRVVLECGLILLIMTPLFDTAPVTCLACLVNDQPPIDLLAAIMGEGDWARWRDQYASADALTNMAYELNKQAVDYASWFGVVTFPRIDVHVEGGDIYVNWAGSLPEVINITCVIK